MRQHGCVVVAVDAVGCWAVGTDADADVIVYAVDANADAAGQSRRC